MLGPIGLAGRYADALLYGLYHKKEPVLSPKSTPPIACLLQLPETAFPDSPENAIFPIYRKLLKKLGYPVNV